MQNKLKKLGGLCITVISIISWVWLAQKYCRKCFFLWYFFLPQQSGSITQQHVKMRGTCATSGPGHGSTGFLLSVAVPGLAAEGQGTRAGTVALASSQQPEMPGPLWGRWQGSGRVGCGLWAGTGLGRRALASLLSPPYLTSAEKLINLRCRFVALGQFLLYLNESAQHPHTA